MRILFSAAIRQAICVENSASTAPLIGGFPAVFFKQINFQEIILLQCNLQGHMFCGLI
jgi:hypothetical protein